MKCPSCGATINYDQKFSLFFVCEYCHAALVFDEKALSVAGKMSLLSAPSGPVFTGAEGTLAGNEFTVTGRIRYGYDTGFLDELNIIFDDGTKAWFSEDEKRFMLETLQSFDLAPDVIKNASLGTSLKINNKIFTVKEKGSAVCEGGEGHLSFKIVTGERITYYDLLGVDGTTATIEIEPDGEINFFTGTRVTNRDIVLHNPEARPSAKQPDFEKKAGNDSRERIGYNATRITAVKCLYCGADNQNINLNEDVHKCSSCGTPLGLPEFAFTCKTCGSSIMSMSPDAASLVCSSCGSVAKVNGDKLSLVAKLDLQAKKKRDNTRIFIPLGSWATFDELDFQMVGVICYVETDDGKDYFTDEYLYYNKSYGYRWLTCYEGHLYLQDKLKIPIVDSIDNFEYLGYKDSITIADKKWQFFEKGQITIDYVEGELPWVAKTGDTLKYIEFIAPPEILTCEIADNEVEWTKSSYLTHKELKNAVHVENLQIPAKQGIGAGELNPNKASILMSSALAIIFFFAGIVFSIVSCSSGHFVKEINLKFSDYSDEFITSSFELNNPSGLYEIKLFSPVRNAWVSLELALVNDKDEAVMDFSSNISFYSGVEGGESWSEGSNTDSIYLKGVSPGTYRLILRGESGRGNIGTDSVNGPPVVITIYDGVKLSRYYIIFTILMLLTALALLFLLAWFEIVRWKHTFDYGEN